jgi:hypothetical protein
MFSNRDMAPYMSRAFNRAMRAGIEPPFYFRQRNHVDPLRRAMRIAKLSRRDPSVTKSTATRSKEARLLCFIYTMVEAATGKALLV